MWITENEKEQVCTLSTQLKPDMSIADVEKYLNVLEHYCNAQSRDEIFQKLNKEEVIDFCYRSAEGYPDHYDALDTNHKQIIRQCVLAYL